jgi:hypothetical protein
MEKRKALDLPAVSELKKTKRSDVPRLEEEPQARGNFLPIDPEALSEENA